MTIGKRLTVWYAGILILSLAVMVGLVHHELIEQQTILATRPAQADPPWEEAGEILLFYGLPTAALLLIGGGWLLRKSLSPIRALTLSAERLRANNLKQRLPRSGNGDELDRLTQVFNDMTARLDESFTATRDFTLHASHELKTPLSVMRARVETALRDPECAEKHRTLFEAQLEEIQRMAKIVDGLAFLARVDSGAAQWALESLRLDELVKESFADTQALAAPRAISVSLGACDEAQVTGDRHRMRQLLLNLVSNAIAYSQAGGWITFDLLRKNGRAELRIANSGPGIAPEALPRIFDRFFRGDPSRDREIDGCGLGLSIAKSIVVAHGGAIDINSTPNVETVARVTLPLCDATAANPPLKSAA